MQSDDESLCEKDIFARPELCPKVCPYAAEMSDKFCHFRCVKKEECGLLGTVENATIPDDRLMLCRHCAVEGCARCVPGSPGQSGEKLENCQQCMPGYGLTADGECEMHGLAIFIGAAVVLVIATILVVVWYCLIASKPCVNPEGVQYGMECRERMRLTQPRSTEPYPLSTNLLRENVAGPGTMALFRYQFALLVWASGLLLAWLGFVLFVSSDLLILGSREAESPQMLCAVIAWGHARQMELVWTKVSWLVFAYLFSFGGAVFYGIQQTKLFKSVHTEHATMQSFAAKLEGFAPMTGQEKAEEKLKEAITAAIGSEPVAVSVAWDFTSKRHLVEAVLDQEVSEAGHTDHPESPPETEPMAAGALNKAEEWATDIVLNAWHVHLEEHAVNTSEIKSMLDEMSSTSTAYVVFSSQETRLQAVLQTARDGIMVGGRPCSLTECQVAPEGLFWHNMHVTPAQRSGKIGMAILALVASCAVWTFLLYIPYAYYMASFSYANGDEPGEFSEGLFICLVVGSQLGLFVVSSMGAKHACFHSEDETQKAYTMFYNAALILNLVMDIALQTYLSYLQMVGVGAHTSDGRLLGSLDSLQQIFESYPIQKSVGKLLFVYCWPCTFFVPFLAEPLAVQWLPKHLAQYIVGANKRIQGENAEKALELGEMEQGRYADCIFNVILLCCIPFISPAYLGMTLAALIFSHGYLYLYDQIKVLRFVRKFNFSDPEVHWLGMQLFAIPCSILAGALVFKANQMSSKSDVLGSGYFQGGSLLAAVVGAAVLHFALHLALLELVVKPMGQEHDLKSNALYAYLSTNPIFCLRSKYVLGHNPPQMMYFPGKEHLMQPNSSIPAYYQGPSAKSSAG